METFLALFRIPQSVDSKNLVHRIRHDLIIFTAKVRMAFIASLIHITWNL